MESFTEILQNFNAKLGLKPAWLVLQTIDGLTVAAVNITWKLTEYEGNPEFLVNAIHDYAESTTQPTSLGSLQFALISTQDGFILITPILDEFILGAKYQKERDLQSIASQEQNIHSSIEDLSENIQ